MGLLDYVKRAYYSFIDARDTQTIGGLGFRYNQWQNYQNNAMTQTAVHRAVRLIAEQTALLPLNVHRKKDRTIVENHALMNIFNMCPNNLMDSMTFRELMISDLLLNGNFYAEIERNGQGEIVGLYPITSTSVQIYVEGKDIAYKCMDVVIPASRMFHVKYNTIDGIIGKSVIKQFQDVFDLNNSAVQYAQGFFTNGGRPSGILSTDQVIKDKATIERIRDGWKSSNAGENGGGVAVLEAGLKYQPISVNPADAQYLESRKFGISEVARIFGVPLHMLAEMDKATFSNIEHQAIEFVQTTLSPFMKRIEQAIVNQLLTTKEKMKYDVRHDADELLRGDIKTRYESYALGIQNGFMSRNDVRKYEDMPLIEGGDDILVNSAMFNVTQNKMLNDTSQTQGVNTNDV